MKLRHVRNGVELDRIVEDDTYDFNYQQVRQLENETTVLPGDYLITDCAYEVCLTCSYLFCVANKFVIKLHNKAKQNKEKQCLKSRTLTQMLRREILILISLSIRFAIYCNEYGRRGA